MHVLLEVLQTELLDELQGVGVHVHHGMSEVVEHVLRALPSLAQGVGITPKDGALLGRVGRILLRHDPLRGALEEREVLDSVDDCGRDLHGCGPGADDAETRPVELRGVVPAGAVKDRPLEALQAFDLGVLRMMEDAGRGDDHVDLVPVTGGRGDPPAAFHEFTAGDLVSEADAREDAVLLGNPFEVGLDLLAGREAATPFGPQRERVGVEMGRHVAREARIGVLTPGASDPVALLVDGEITETRLGQLDRGEDPRHPGPDDRTAQRPRPPLHALS